MQEKLLLNPPKQNLPPILAIESEEGHMRSASVPMQRKTKPLYKEMEEKFKANVENLELEKRKKALEQIRSMKKPMQKEELEEHAKKYLEIREKKKEDHEMEQRNKKKISDHMT